MSYQISVIGLGFVGNSMYQTFLDKGIDAVGYDKYKNIGSLEACLTSDIMFLCLPTVFNEETNEYDKSCIIETCEALISNAYRGVVVLKSTVEPQTTSKLADQFPDLYLVHNPEFLTARTAYEDFKNTKHVVLGKGPNVTDDMMAPLVSFYQKYFPDAEISIATSDESESMKIFLNCFYSVKVQFFNEIYLLCKKMGCEYDRVLEMMLKNGWINPMHTQVPGPDGLLSYGGYCFPKDTNALLNHMRREDVPHGVLEACVEERNMMREDRENISVMK